MHGKDLPTSLSLATEAGLQIPTKQTNKPRSKGGEENSWFPRSGSDKGHTELPVFKDVMTWVEHLLACVEGCAFNVLTSFLTWKTRFLLFGVEITYSQIIKLSIIKFLINCLSDFKLTQIKFSLHTISYYMPVFLESK